MKRQVILTVAALLAVTTAPRVQALEKPRPGVEDGRVRFVEYRPFNVTRIVGSLRSSVQIEFAADEEITHVALGNSVAWEVAVAGNILFFKAREKQPVTNAQVVTIRRDGSRRSYQLEVVIADDEQLTQSYFYVKFRYAADEALARTKDRADKAATLDAGKVDVVLAQDELRGPRNWAYTARGSKAIEPVQVYDNGQVTVFVFAGNQEIPAIFIVNADGSETLIPKNMDGNLVRVHATARKFVLRRGGDVVGVFNERFDAVGVRPWTNTTSASVERVVDNRMAKVLSPVAPTGVAPAIAVTAVPLAAIRVAPPIAAAK